jgi:natural product biosynthesis luciferase-like monooxygenase protein
MRFGINHLFHGRQDSDARRIYRDALEQTVLAEELGFSSVWLAEHHFSNYGILPHLPTFGAAVAARTERIRIGTAVVVLPFGHPLRIAEEIAMLDVLSDGRVDLGVGRGYQPMEFAALGVAPDDAQEIFDESLAIMRAAWSDGPVEFEGRHFQIHDVDVLPKPVQPGGPPVRIAAVSSRTFERMGRRGEAIMLSPNFTPVETTKASLAAYYDAAREEGHDLSTMPPPPLLQQVYIDDDDAVAKSEPEPYSTWFFARMGSLLPSQSGDLGAQYREYKKIAESVNTVTYERIVKEGAAFGDAESIIERLRFLEDQLGVEEIVCWFNFGDLAHERVLANMKMFADRVIPAFATG